MDQPQPSKPDRIQVPSSDELNLIQDPEVGLELLSRCQGEETPEQTHECQFWQFQFMAMRDWRNGDVTAVGRAMVDCSIFNRPPPFWLLKAGAELGVRCMSDAEKLARSAMNTHYQRWKAVKLVRGRHPKDPRNYTKKVRGDTVWAAAAKMLANEGVKCRPGTVKKSYALIENADGAQVTLPSYKREVEKRERRRKENGRRRKKRKKLG